MKKIFPLMALLLCAVAAQATITATWSWKTTTPSTISSVSLQSKTGTVASDVDGVTMFVDATSGKLASNGDNAQFNSGTILRIPVVSTSDVVSFAAHPSGYSGVTIGTDDYDGTASTEQTHTATAAEVKQGYVVITSKGGYLYSVQVEMAYKPVSTITANWDWVHTNPSTLSEVKLEQYAGDPIDVASDVAGISLQFVSGKLWYNTTNAQFNSGTILRIPVTSTSDFITVDANSYSFTDYKIGLETYTTCVNTYQATDADVAAGYVQIESGCAYLNALKLEKRATATIGTIGWATFSNAACATDFTDLSGVVNAYTISGAAGKSVTLSDAVTTAAANTGLLLNAPTPGTYAIPLASSGTDYGTTNKLMAGTGAAVAFDANSGYNYVLVNNGGTAEFQKIVDGAYNSATIPVGKAYLALTADPGARALTLFDDMTTGINAVNGEGLNVQGAEVYNLNGQRVLNPTKGLYIVNGRKVVIK